MSLRRDYLGVCFSQSSFFCARVRVAKDDFRGTCPRSPSKRNQKLIGWPTTLHTLGFTSHPATRIFLAFTPVRKEQ